MERLHRLLSKRARPHRHCQRTRGSHLQHQYRRKNAQPTLLCIPTPCSAMVVRRSHRHQRARGHLLLASMLLQNARRLPRRGSTARGSHPTPQHSQATHEPPGSCAGKRTSKIHSGSKHHPKRHVYTHKRVHKRNIQRAVRAREITESATRSELKTKIASQTNK